MARHISKQQQVKNLLSDLETAINRNNVDIALPLLEWTKEKIDLSYRKKREWINIIRPKRHKESQDSLKEAEFTTLTWVRSRNP